MHVENRLHMRLGARMICRFCRVDPDALTIGLCRVYFVGTPKLCTRPSDDDAPDGERPTWQHGHVLRCNRIDKAGAPLRWCDH